MDTVGDKAPSAPTEIETVVGGESYQPVPASPALSELQASPLVTWGNVAATPERIGLGEADGRSFRILKTRRREEVAMRLEKKTKRKVIPSPLRSLFTLCHPPTSFLLSWLYCQN